MSAINLTWTTLGVNAIATGNGFVIDTVKLGNGAYEPSVSAVALQTEQASINPSSTDISAGVITIELLLTDASAFSVREFGLFLADGTMVAVYSHLTNIIAQKVANAQVQIILAIEVGADVESNISFAVSDFGHADLQAHLANSNNPHNITRAQIGALSAVQITTLVNGLILAATPTGKIDVFPCAVAPNGYLALSGQLVNKNTYARLWAFAQASGNLTATQALWTDARKGSFCNYSNISFRLPDLRGEFIRALGVGRNIGSNQADEIKSHKHAISGLFRYHRGAGGGGGGQLNAGGSGVDTTNTGGDETRPKNIAYLYCIKF